MISNARKSSQVKYSLQETERKHACALLDLKSILRSNIFSFQIDQTVAHIDLQAWFCALADSTPTVDVTDLFSLWLHSKITSFSLGNSSDRKSLKNRLFTGSILFGYKWMHSLHTSTRANPDLGHVHHECWKRLKKCRGNLLYLHSDRSGVTADLAGCPSVCSVGC